MLSQEVGLQEVEYDLNPTDLYDYICKSDWESALYTIASNPIEANIWVVKREVRSFECGEIACRFLPLHSACARNPPLSIISALIDAYPEGCAARDDNGMYPLHYATANQASFKVIKILLKTFPEANFFRIESQGTLPIHLVSQWGASSLEVMEVLLKNRSSLACAKNYEGKTPLEVALAAGNYDGKEALVQMLKDVAERDDSEESTSSTISSKTKDVIVLDHSNVVSLRFSQMEGESRDEVPSKVTKEDNNNSAVVSFSAKKSVKRMEAEIIALRAQKALIKAETEEQIAHEWKEVCTMIAELKYEMDKSQNEMREKRYALKLMGFDRLVEESDNDINNNQEQRPLIPKDDNNEPQPLSPEDNNDEQYTLTLEEKIELYRVQEENAKLEIEHTRIKKEHNAYNAKFQSMKSIMNDLTSLTKKLMLERKESYERITAMESNMQVNSAIRQTKLQQLLNDEQMYSTNIMSGRDSSNSVQDSKRTEKLTKKESTILKKYDLIFQDLSAE